MITQQVQVRDLIRIAFPEGERKTQTLEEVYQALPGATPRSVAASIAAAVRWGFLRIIITKEGKVFYQNTR